jgi:Common central domain of tyrosinase
MNIRKSVTNLVPPEWHRAYLYWFEKYLQDAQKDPTVTVPFWDYTAPLKAPTDN